ncbi:Sodium-dependent nutrient amino acid transporter 1, partial [Orchesella cincta]
WKCAPFFKGVGYGSMIATMAVLTYYVSIMALTVYYFVASFQKNLPWANCDEKWAGEGNCNGSGSATGQSVPEMFFLREVIKESANIDNGVGTPDWKLSLCLLFSWILIFGTLIRGVHSSGKVGKYTKLFGWGLAAVALLAFPAFGFQAMTKVVATFWPDKFMGSFKPHPSWGPRNPKKRLEWLEFKQARPPMTLLERFRAKQL